MLLEGSCHCQCVRFSLESAHPYPFNLCYCSICRKTAGAGGSAINLGGDYNTLQVEGEDYISVYQAKLRYPDTGEEERSPGRRSFCSRCGSQLWVYDPRWPDLVHPHASAIDTELPVPPERNHIMLDSKANWVEVPKGEKDYLFDSYPEESLAEWHQRLGLEK